MNGSTRQEGAQGPRPRHAEIRRAIHQVEHWPDRDLFEQFLPPKIKGTGVELAFSNRTPFGSSSPNRDPTAALTVGELAATHFIR